MKDLLKFTAATAALVLGVSSANAAMLLKEDPLTGQKTVINTETEAEADVFLSEDGNPAAECPEGAYFYFEEAGEQYVQECVGERRFVAGDITEGTFPPNQDIPEGAFLLTEESATGEKEVVTEEEVERRGAEMPQEIDPHERGAVEPAER